MRRPIELAYVLLLFPSLLAALPCMNIIQHFKPLYRLWKLNASTHASPGACGTVEQLPLMDLALGESADRLARQDNTCFFETVTGLCCSSSASSSKTLSSETDECVARICLHDGNWCCGSVGHPLPADVDEYEMKELRRSEQPHEVYTKLSLSKRSSIPDPDGDRLEKRSSAAASDSNHAYQDEKDIYVG